MRFIKLTLAICAFFCVLSTVEAAPPVPPGKWQCFATNARGMRFFQNAFARQAAMNGAMQHCYAAGSAHCFPGQCYFNGSTRPWTCVVRDVRGRRWQRTSVTGSCAMAMAACNRWHVNRGITGYSCSVVTKYPS